MKRPDDESRCLALANEARTAHGLPALRRDARVRRLARERAGDNRAGRLSHQSPAGGSLWDMLRQAGIPFAYAGENLARAGNVWCAHWMLMNSDGHRRNILRDQFTRVGIGVVDAAGSGLVVAQIFLRPHGYRRPARRTGRTWIMPAARYGRGR